MGQFRCSSNRYASRYWWRSTYDIATCGTLGYGSESSFCFGRTIPTSSFHQQVPSSSQHHKTSRWWMPDVVQRCSGKSMFQWVYAFCSSQVKDRLYCEIKLIIKTTILRFSVWFRTWAASSVLRVIPNHTYLVERLRFSSITLLSLRDSYSSCVVRELEKQPTS